MLPSGSRSRFSLVAALMAGLSACGGGGDDDIGVDAPSAGDTYALTTGNRLISFNRATPGTPGTSVPITGLGSGETLVGMDFRPADGLLYGVSSASRIYTINVATGVATAGPTISLTAGGAAIPLEGTAFGVDFNPVPDRLRLVSDNNQNLRINVTTGVTVEDTDLSGPGAGGVSAVAYTNSFSNACRTTIYYLDTSKNLLLTASGNPNGGVTTSVGALRTAAAPVTAANSISAFEISSVSESSNTAYAVLSSASGAILYTLDLTTGVLTSRGTIGAAAVAGEGVRGLAMAPPATLPTVAAGDLYAVTDTDRLVSFTRNSPNKFCSDVAIPVSATEDVVGIDFRPSTGALYALINANGTARVAQIDVATGAISASSPLGGSTPVALVGTDFGMDFNPTGPVALRIVSDTGQNLRVTNPDTGAVIADTPLNPGAPVVTAAAYTNSVAGGPTSTTLYVIDSGTDMLMTQGSNPSVAGSGSCPASTGNPNCGLLTNVGALTVNVGAVNGFDIDGRDNSSFLAASASAGAPSTLYTVNLASGAATVVAGGPIGSSSGFTTSIRGLTRPAPTTTVFALRGGNELLTVPLADPAAAVLLGTIGGLGSETLVGIDVRPATGTLVGLGSAGTVFNLTTTAPVTATAVAASNTSLTGTAFGVDFNPTVDRIRVVSNTEENLRVNPITGLRADSPADAALSRAALSIQATAYTNSFVLSGNTTELYGLDSSGDKLVVIAPPNAGTTRVVGGLGFDVTATSMMDIAGLTTALAVLDGAAKTLYTVNISTGAATAVGTIASVGNVLGIAAEITTADPDTTSKVYAVDAVGPSLIQFQRGTPGTLASAPIPITGLGLGETVRGIDFRPGNGLLWALTVDASNGGRLYTIDLTSGAAMPVSTLTADPNDTSSPYTALAAGSDIDFNPVPAAVPLRIVNGTQNLRVSNPGPGAATPPAPLTMMQPAGSTFTDTAIAELAPDVVDAAYTNSFAGTTTTTLYDLDVAIGSLVLQGGVGGTPSPNAGVLTTVGPLSASDTFAAAGGFDIAGGANGIVLAALQKNGETASRLYRVNLATGAATEVSSGVFIGGLSSAPVSGLAIRLQ